MKERLSGKAIVVTGGASGIGEASARIMAQQGASVIIGDINVEGAKAVAEEIKRSGGKATALKFDLYETTGIKTFIDEAAKVYGGLDVLFNNAADTKLSSTKDGNVEDIEVENWDRIITSTLRGPMLATKYAIPHIRARGGGSIIFTSSGAGLIGTDGISAYGTAKAGIARLAQYVAVQLGKDNIRCNAIAPGTILTPALDPKTFGSGPVLDIMMNNTLTTRLGKPEDIAWTATWLASDESAFVTGQCISVDGGLMAHQPFWSDFRALAAAAQKS